MDLISKFGQGGILKLKIVSKFPFFLILRFNKNLKDREKNFISKNVMVKNKK
jgi:hypothetical protein